MSNRLRASMPAVIVALLAVPASASATTFCVPTFHAACPNNGSNVASATPEAASTTNGSDGVADKVIIAAGTYTDADTFEPTGSDPLEIQGAGAASTILTTSAASNIYVVNTGFRKPGMVIKNLRIVVPATMPDGQGSAAQLSDSTLDGVDIEVRNPGSNGISSFTKGTFRDGRIYATGAGTIPTAIRPNGANGAGTVTLDRASIEGAVTAVVSDVPTVPVTVVRSSITGSSQVGVTAVNSSALVENSVLTTTGVANALQANTNGSSTTPASLTARHVTVVGGPGVTGSGVGSSVSGSPTASATLTLTSSIVRGYAKPYARAAPVSIAIGNANLSIADSNVGATGTSVGDGTLTRTRVIDADPLFTSASDFHLLAGSPSIDTADPASDVAVDRDGTTRPLDGNGDNLARADQGAYEAPAVPYVPPVDPPPVDPPPVDPPPVTKDTTPPQLTALGASGRLSARRGGKVRFTLSEAARVTLTFKRRGSRRTVTRTVMAPAGTTTVVIRRGKLRRARYTVRAQATDAAGNTSAAVRRRVRVGR